MTVFSIILVCFVGLASQISLAEANLEILAVHIADEIDGAKRYVAYQNPCDSKAFGIYIDSKDDASEIKIGVVVQRPHARCVGMDKTEFVDISHLIFAPHRQLVSYNPSIEPVRYDFFDAYRDRLRRPLRNRDIDSKNGQGLAKTTDSIEALYWAPSCGKFMGLVLPLDKQSSRENVLGAIEELGFVDCSAYENKVNSISNVSLKASDEQAPLLTQSTDALRRFQTRMTVMKPGSLKVVRNQVDGTQQLSFKYLRQCHEAPLGITVQTGKAKILVSMVLVSFDKSICSDSAHAAMWSTYTTKLLNVNALDRIQIRTSLSGTPKHILVQEPNRVKLTKKGEMIKFEAIRSCLPAISTLFVERHNRNYAAIIREAGQKKQDCGDPFSHVNLSQRLLANALRVSQIAPLELIQ